MKLKYLNKGIFASGKNIIYKGEEQRFRAGNDYEVDDELGEFLLDNHSENFESYEQVSQTVEDTKPISQIVKVKPGWYDVVIGGKVINQKSLRRKQAEEMLKEYGG